MKVPLLLLHGAIGASDQLIPLKEELKHDFPIVHLFDFPGHGGVEFPKNDFSIKLFAESLLAFMDENEMLSVNIFGYSMGGYVGLYLAKHFPNRVNSIVTLATKFEWTEAIAEKEVKLLNPEKIAEKVPKFAKALEERHAPNNWKDVLKKTSEMMLHLGKNPELKDADFENIPHKVLMLLGDADTMVTVAETEKVHQLLSNSELRIIESTPHPIEQVDLAKIISPITEFLNTQ